LKRVLIISPYFPPTNAADMQRVRMSLPYFQLHGWEPEVVTVDDKYSDMVKDDLLLQSIPADITIHKIKALNKSCTSKLGLGSIALRSIPYYRKMVNQLLKSKTYHLIYFSTTQFPVCILGPYWKKKFNIPYVIDMQDPWHSNYYQDKPKEQQPSKYWLSYRLNKYMEPIAMKKVDGLISVSDHYIYDLKARYIELESVPSATITFGAFEPDLKIAFDNQTRFKSLLESRFKNIVYVGRGGADMQKAIAPVFEALKRGLNTQPELFGKLRFYFIGTSYAPSGKRVATILPIAKQYGVEDSVIEITDRISYYHTLLTLHQADALFIPGSDDPKYTASKIYPYLLAQKPLLAIFNRNSNAVAILNECSANATILTFGEESNNLAGTLYKILEDWANNLFKPIALSKKIEKYSAEKLTGKQTELFNQAIKYFATQNTDA